MISTVLFGAEGTEFMITDTAGITTNTNIEKTLNVSLATDNLSS